jgi:putative transposase
MPRGSWQGEGGPPVEEICRKMGVAEATYFRLKKKCGGLGISMIRTLVNPVSQW